MQNLETEETMRSSTLTIFFKLWKIWTAIDYIIEDLNQVYLDLQEKQWGHHLIYTFIIFVLQTQFLSIVTWHGI